MDHWLLNTPIEKIHSVVEQLKSNCRYGYLEEIEIITDLRHDKIPIQEVMDPPEEWCEYAAKNKIDLSLIPIHRRNKKVCLLASEWLENIFSIPQSVMTEEMVNNIAKRNPSVWIFVPEALKKAWNKEEK